MSKYIVTGSNAYVAGRLIRRMLAKVTKMVGLALSARCADGLDPVTQYRRYV